MLMYGENAKTIAILYMYTVLLYCVITMNSCANTGLLVLCQSSSTDSGSCPGDDITFTCVTSIVPVIWSVFLSDRYGTSCTVFQDGAAETTDMCGPMDRFTATVTGPDSTTLTVQSVDDVINGSRVECLNTDVEEEICIIGQCLQKI